MLAYECESLSQDNIAAKIPDTAVSPDAFPKLEQHQPSQRRTAAVKGVQRQELEVLSSAWSFRYEKELHACHEEYEELNVGCAPRKRAKSRLEKFLVQHRLIRHNCAI